jgi:hypothetical protein
MTKYALSWCPAAVGMDIVESMQWNMQIAVDSGAAANFLFLDDMQHADRALAGSWLTQSVRPFCAARLGWLEPTACLGFVAGEFWRLLSFASGVGQGRLG